jgi:DNA-binding transcriptional MerR regulator
LVSLAATAENLPLSDRLARQYIADGLIPAPRTKGGGIAYGDEHLMHLRLVLRLASQYVQARDIQKFISRYSIEGLRALVDGPVSPRLPSEGDVAAYLTRLSRSVPPSHVMSAPFRESIAAAARSVHATPRPRGISTVEAPKSPTPASILPGVERSSWLRVVIDPDIELHIRVRSNAESKRLVDSLVAAIQDVIATERGTDV